jgi:hypothetical protein
VKVFSVPSFNVIVYLAGDFETARTSLRKQFMENGLCVTLTRTSFIYTAGVEEGIAVGFVNYPRFPKSHEEILERAKSVALKLMDDLCQWSALVVSPEETIWLNQRPEELK